jgi:hypothetical protein
MNDDFWGVFLTVIKRWKLGIRAASPRSCPAVPAAPGAQRRPLRVKGQSQDLRQQRGRKHFVDPPAAVQMVAPEAASPDQFPVNRGARGVDAKRTSGLKSEPLRVRKRISFGSVIQRFLAVRNRRMGPRLAGPQNRLARAYRLGRDQMVGQGWVFNDPWQDGEAAGVEPP